MLLGETVGYLRSIYQEVSTGLSLLEMFNQIRMSQNLH